MTVGSADTGQLGKDLEKTAVAGVERAVNGGNDSGGGILDWRLAAVAAEGVGRGPFDDLGDHC